MVFFGCRMPDKSTRKADIKVCEQLLCQVFNGERNPPLMQSLPVHKCNISKRFAHMGVERQTILHTYIHTHFL